MLTLALALTLAQAPPHSPPSHYSRASKKDAYLAAKAEAAKAEAAKAEAAKAEVRVDRAAAAGARADRPIWAHNLRTHEIRALTGPAGIAEGPEGQAARSEFFRCWFTEGEGPIPAGLFARVIAAAAHFEVREVRVISGFRHRKYNLSLVKKGREVALDSHHTRGHAIDFFLPEVETRALYDWLLAVHDGGVGFYPVSAFVHVDLGRKRTWRGT